MIHSIYLSIIGILINQIPLFYELFTRNSKQRFYKFEYKNVRFFYFLYSKSLYIQTEVDKIIGKRDITLNDKEEFINKLIEIITKFVNIKKKDIKFNVCRIDYKVDIQFTSLEMSNMHVLMSKHRTNYKKLKATGIYDTSISLATPYSGLKINVYDKWEKCRLPEWKGVLRVELQVKNRKLHRLLKKEGIKRNINVYWTKEFMEKYYFLYYEGYFYLGDYYKLNICKKLIRESNYSMTIKKGLIKFVTEVNRLGMTKVCEKYSYNKVRRYIDYLNNIKVNPITINNDSEINKIQNIVEKAREVAEERYFKD